MTTRKPSATAPAIAASVLLALGVSACTAAPRDFNPENLPAVSISGVAQVCQKVMGLSPTERLVGGDWLGGAALDYWTSRYRGCIASLSHSLQLARDTRAKELSDRACRAKGYTAGSPALALCVLQSTAALDRTDGTEPAIMGPQDAASIPAAVGSLFYATAHERHRREELACAAVGIEPTGDAFRACADDLRNTLHAIDTPID
ncbi:MAG TPA: hypothetical protein VMC02_10930 [Steroidobacteraceae bacterium]|nr:hypothetical protein [Steroidobacteraceae bacterium]